MSKLPQPIYRPVGTNRVYKFKYLFPAVQAALCVLLLSGLLGYAFLEGQLIYYKKAVLPLNLNATVGPASFKLLDYELIDRPGGPSCVHGQSEVLLIQTSATHFQDIINYSRRVASPNDHDLVAVFVNSPVMGQSWRQLARKGLLDFNRRLTIPSNWVARLSINQGGLGSDVIHSTLIDLKSYRYNQEAWWVTGRTNYLTDSLSEKLLHTCDTCTGYPWPQTIHESKRQINTSDAAYFSPFRQRIQGYINSTSESPPPHTSPRSR